MKFDPNNKIVRFMLLSIVIYFVLTFIVIKEQNEKLIDAI